MNMRNLVIACAFWLTFWMNNSSATDGIDVAELLVTLHQVQDEIARGDLTALPLQGELSERLKDGLESPLGIAKNEVTWATIAIGYALDGAKPQVARRLLARVSAANPLHILAKAVSEYSTGNMKDAAAYFDQIDLDNVDFRIAPHVALAIGTANLSLNEGKTIAYFEKAILLGPGTLVEEVALRRLTQIGLTNSDVALSQRAASLYLKRYHASPFAGQFYALLTKKAPSVLHEQQIKDLAALIVTQLPNTYAPLLLALAESSANIGQLDIVRHYVKTHLKDAKGLPTGLSERVNFYQIVSAPWSNYDLNTSNSIKQINPTALSPIEQILLGKLISVSTGVLEPLTLVDDSKSMKANEFSQAASEIEADGGHEENLAIVPEKVIDTLSQMDASSKEIAKSSQPKKLSDNTAPIRDPLETTALPVGEPIIEQIDVLVSKTKNLVDAVDVLLKESKP